MTAAVAHDRHPLRSTARGRGSRPITADEAIVSPAQFRKATGLRRRASAWVREHGGEAQTAEVAAALGVTAGEIADAMTTMKPNVWVQQRLRAHGGPWKVTAGYPDREESFVAVRVSGHVDQVILHDAAGNVRVLTAEQFTRVTGA